MAEGCVKDTRAVGTVNQKGGTGKLDATGKGPTAQARFLGQHCACPSLYDELLPRVTEKAKVGTSKSKSSLIKGAGIE
jgi:hypothetical protein